MRVVSEFLGIGSQRSQFLVHQDGFPLMRFQFSSVFEKVLVAVRESHSEYGTHSFRIGAATEAVRLASRKGMLCVSRGGSHGVILGMFVRNCFPNNFLFQVLQKFGSLGIPLFVGQLRGRRTSLGVVTSDSRVNWWGSWGLRWAQVLSEVVFLSRTVHVPVILVLHFGGMTCVTYMLGS